MNGGGIFIATLDADCVGFKTGLRKPNPINAINAYYVPGDFHTMLETVGSRQVALGAISSDKLTGTTLPLHQWHMFSVHGIKVRNE